MGFDPITMAATISKLTASGQIGADGKTEKTYTFDGVVGDKPFQNGHVWISADIPSINSIRSVTAIFGGEWITAGKDELRIEAQSDPTSYCAYYGNYPVVVVILQDYSTMGIPAGLWMLYGGDTGYVASVTFESGEVKTIDPKYLPGIPIPELRLSEETAAALLQSGSATLTAEESAALDEALSNKYPVVVSAEMQGILMFNGVAQLGYNLNTNIHYYSLLINGHVNDGESYKIRLTLVVINKTTAGWEAMTIVGDIANA